ncbi:MAG TPA: hypothetical protein PK024_12560 [Methanospirillum sp.]|uniref:hypothetical protein n=1 Tax=Methanospirillum sp. TaxID=45200 RepID=UPI002BAF4BC2|nr:hypothetical protein [Methanospirillum sp.]HOJ97656.1 hypothetical protein [Methanospirillum sp.]
MPLCGANTPTQPLFWIPILLHTDYPGSNAKQDVSILANPLRRPGIRAGITNDNTDRQFSLTSENPHDRAQTDRDSSSRKKQQKNQKYGDKMRLHRRKKDEFPRPVIRLGGITIRAGAVLSYRFIRILSFLLKKTGGSHVV